MVAQNVSHTVWCRRAMIPGEIFTSFAEFPGIVSVIDFRLPFGFHPAKFWFGTDTPGSIEWLSPVPRLRIDDCFEIRNCH